jgi:hypothetical protein
MPAAVRLALALLSAPTLVAGAQEGALPRSHLAVRDGERWITWWRSDSAPSRWAGAHAAVTAAVRWETVAPGVDVATLPLAGRGEAWRMLVVLARIDPAQNRLRLAEGARSFDEGRWTVDSAPTHAAVALNAGQFAAGTPWGWVVLDGVEVLPARRAPLAMALAQDSGGAVHWIEDRELEQRAPHVRPRIAFQSYPTLLVGNGEVPIPLRAAGPGLDVGHRDARLALGELRDGRLLVALTRFDALGEAMQSVPLGATVPEMAALMGALGCRRAMLLDGGISAQLLVRPSLGAVRKWSGYRAVPLGLVVEAHRDVPR